ncbi:hypothetical protein HEK131_05610 [Streptomyces seoulensis]|nr:hypothetical protein HEK131_05610 [Streptomyces seoulensis]
MVRSTSSRLGGPVGAAVPPPVVVLLSAEAMLYIPYPAPPSIVAHTPLMTATLTPLPMKLFLPVVSP